MLEQPNPSPYSNSSASVIESLDSESNYLLSLTAGSVGMLLGAILWGVITYVTGYQIGWMSIGVGFLVAFSMNKFGKGKGLQFGVSSAILSLLGCLLGNLFFYAGVLAREYNLPVFEILFNLLLAPGAVVELFTSAFEVMDLLFYGFALYFGFRYAYAGR